MIKVTAFLLITFKLLVLNIDYSSQQPSFLLPDFGPDGLGGLSSEERVRLQNEEIVVPQKPLILSDGKTIVTAAFIANQSLEQVWAILSKPEKQKEYLAEVKRSELISKEEKEDRVYFEVEIFGVTLRYTVRHRYYPDLKSMDWELDPESKNDLRILRGFWRLYPWGEGRTLARYGSQVVPKFKIANLFVQSFYKTRMKRSLLAVKKYLESGLEKRRF